MQTYTHMHVWEKQNYGHFDKLWHFLYKSVFPSRLHYRAILATNSIYAFLLRILASPYVVAICLLAFCNIVYDAVMLIHNDKVLIKVTSHESQRASIFQLSVERWIKWKLQKWYLFKYQNSLMIVLCSQSSLYSMTVCLGFVESICIDNPL